MAFNLPYISLDDFRVVYSYLAGDGSYTLEDRLNVPNTMFITPALSQVGLTESQAADLKLPYAVKEIPVAAMPRGHVNGDLVELSKLWLILKQKKFLEQHLLRRFSRNHQHHHCCYGQQDSLHLLHKTNLHSPNLG